MSRASVEGLEFEHRMGGFVGFLSMELDNERVYHLSCVKEIFSGMFHGEFDAESFLH